MSKQIFLSASLMFLGHVTYTMQQQQKPSLLAQFLTAVRKKDESHRQLWIKGYISHSQKAKQLPVNEKITFNNIKKGELTDKEIASTYPRSILIIFA